MLSEGLLTVNDVVFNRDLSATALSLYLGLFFCVFRGLNVILRCLGDLLDGLSGLLFTPTLSNLRARGLLRLILLRLFFFFRFLIKVLSSRSVGYLASFASKLFDRRFGLFSWLHRRRFLR